MLEKQSCAQPQICITDPHITLTEEDFRSYFALLQSLFLGIEPWREATAEIPLLDLYGVPVDPTETHYMRYLQGNNGEDLSVVLARASMERLLIALFHDNGYFYTTVDKLEENHKEIVLLNAERRSQNRVNAMSNKTTVEESEDDP